LRDRANFLRIRANEEGPLKTALRVANLPEEEFKEAIQGERPATVTQLAERGKQTRMPLRGTSCETATSSRRRAAAGRRWKMRPCSPCGQSLFEPRRVGTTHRKVWRHSAVQPLAKAAW